MRAARLGVAVVLLAVLAAPVVAPFVGAFRRPESWAAWSDSGRIGSFVLHTIALALGAILVAVPGGAVGGIVLSRLPIVGRRIAIGLVVLGMFIPLPVYAVAWQVILSGWIPSDPVAPGVVAWRPWDTGLLPASWVHGTAAVPWVIGIVWAGLTSTDRGLEEDALLTDGPRGVVRQVLLPRVVPAAAVAAAWVAVQCATEIAVTDAMMVPTVAEEAYTQLAVGQLAGAAAAAAVTFPFLVLSVAGGIHLVRRVDRFLPSASDGADRPVSLRPGRTIRIGASVFVWIVIVLFAGLPLAAIVGKAAGGETPGGADAGRLFDTLGRLLRTDGWVLGESLLAATAAGAIASALAWFACGLAVRCRWLASFLLVLCVALWLTPGPLVGFGLKEVFDGLMTVEDTVVEALDLKPSFLSVRSLVYDQPSPVPVVWAAVVRLFPIAVAVIWPAVRSVPCDLLDLAVVDGLGVSAYFRQVLTPVAGKGVPIAAVAVAALALGEVSAGKVVTPPGYRAYVLELFAHMHYGTDATVCGLCLLQLAAVGTLGSIATAINASRRRSKTDPLRVPTPPVRPE